MKALRGCWPAVAIAVAVAGCATMQAPQARDTERWLADVGFERRTANTPDELADLHALPPRTFVERTRDGGSEYVYADPGGCQCSYVGTAQQYDEFQKLQRRGGSTRARARSVEDFVSPFGADTNWWW